MFSPGDKKMNYNLGLVTLASLCNAFQGLHVCTLFVR